MSDIALRAGVSRPTVSVILNQREDSVGIRAETRQRVLDVAAELGYRRNELARAVGSGQNRMIGFLATAPQVEFVSHVLVGALDEAENSNYTLKILRMRDNVLDESVINRCIELRIAAVIATHVNNETSLAYLHKELTQQGIPIAIVDSSFPHPWGIRIITDDEEGAAAATAHLIELGHRRIAYLGGAPESGTSPLRENGFRRALSQAGLSINEANVICAYGDTSRAAEIAHALLTRPLAYRPTAIVCYSDYLALATIRTAHKLGLRLPEDLSVVGYGNLARTELSSPALTTVAQPFYNMGVLAVHSLLERVQAPRNHAEEGEDIDAPIEHFLPTRLVVRESTAPPTPH